MLCASLIASSWLEGGNAVMARCSDRELAERLAEELLEQCGDSWQAAADGVVRYHFTCDGDQAWHVIVECAGEFLPGFEP